MNLTELLELLVKDSGLGRRKQEDAFALIKELHKLNAFSNVALATEAEHEHVWRWVQATGTGWAYSYQIKSTSHYQCMICNKKKEPNE